MHGTQCDLHKYHIRDTKRHLPPVVQYSRRHWYREDRHATELRHWQFVLWLILFVGLLDPFAPPAVHTRSYTQSECGHIALDTTLPGYNSVLDKNGCIGWCTLMLA